MNRWLEALKQLKKYPSAVVGLAIIAFMVGLSVYTVIAIPYGQALDKWRGGKRWQAHPVNAAPAWTNWFRREKLPSTIVVGSAQAAVLREAFPGGQRVQMTIPFEYRYSMFPSEMNLFLEAQFREQEPFARMTWHTPDGRKIPLGGRRVTADERVSISQDWNLARRLGETPHVGLLADPTAAGSARVLQGRYELEIEAILFEEDARLEASFVSYGRVHGPAGTDHQRRELMVALLWGMPVALAFGLIAAVGTTITTLIIAAVGVWFGGWIDALIQRITEVNMILPMLPILVMVGTLYSTSIWLMLGVVVAFGIFSAGIKMYRAMLLPVVSAPYIEAARAYGVGHSRIVLRYMIPRILPVLIPGFVTLIPTFVFLEASLAVLGLGDPVLPTWGKVLDDSLREGALYNRYYYWVIEPAALLMLTGLGFAMVGFALDRIFNPRLRAI
jgi:peptide/nickel transport system permease protein